MAESEDKKTPNKNEVVEVVEHFATDGRTLKECLLNIMIQELKKEQS